MSKVAHKIKEKMRRIKEEWRVNEKVVYPRYASVKFGIFKNERYFGFRKHTAMLIGEYAWRCLFMIVPFVGFEWIAEAD